MTIFINGRYLTIAKSGVHRVAREIVGHLDSLLENEPGLEDWCLLHPEGAEAPKLKHIRCEAVAGPPGQLWEQTALVRAARSGVLFNPANTAPLRAGHSIVMVHDAQVYDVPQSYSLMFRAWYKFMLPRVCAHAVSVATVSRHSAKRLAANGVIAHAEDAEVVLNGVDHILDVEPDPSLIVEKDLGKRPFLLGFASDQPHKNTRLLLEIARDPRLAGFDLALVGSQLPGGAAPHGVKLLGPVLDTRLRALYAACFAFLIPSLTEGFGLPAGEAMLCGAPVIASATGALGEIWRGGARLAGPERPAEWVEAILELEDPGKREDRRRKGFAHAASFTWRAAAARVRSVIERASAKVNESHRSRAS